MIVHVLRFSFKDDVTADERDEVFAALGRVASVDAVSFSVIGQDLGDPAEGFTHAYCVGVEDFDALRRYQYDPSHPELAWLFASRIGKLAVVDLADDPDPALGERMATMHRAWLAEDPALAELLGSFAYDKREA